MPPINIEPDDYRTVMVLATREWFGVLGRELPRGLARSYVRHQTSFVPVDEGFLRGGLEASLNDPEIRGLSTTPPPPMGEAEVDAKTAGAQAGDDVVLTRHATRRPDSETGYAASIQKGRRVETVQRTLGDGRVITYQQTFGSLQAPDGYEGPILDAVEADMETVVQEVFDDATRRVEALA